MGVGVWETTAKRLFASLTLLLMVWVLLSYNGFSDSLSLSIASLCALGLYLGQQSGRIPTPFEGKIEKKKGDEVEELWEGLAAVYSLLTLYRLEDRIHAIPIPILNFLLFLAILGVLLLLLEKHKQFGLVALILLYIINHIEFGYDPEDFLIYLIVPALVIIRIYQYLTKESKYNKEK